MRNEKYINLLKEELKNYGNITLEFLLNKIDEEEKELINIQNKKLKWTEYYGKGAYELSGERYSNTGTLKKLLEQIFNSKISLLNLSDLDDEYIEEIIIYEELADELLDAIYENGHIGNSCNVEYELEFIEGKPNKDILKKYLRRLKNEDDWNYEKLDKYFNF